ncbi:YicC/YloC family endoribonuclease [Poseidonocella sedimentorum]|nr:YicC/YloC family endoribonuclease [Poseidonocella sedimentorum]
MTGFAALSGTGQGLSSAWELRSVNARGLDLRLRVPDTVPGLDAALREKLGAALTRGSVSLSLKLEPERKGAQTRLAPEGLGAALDLVAGAEQAAAARGLTLAPSPASAVISMPGVLVSGAEAPDTEALRARLLGEADELIAALVEMRAGEGAALAAILADQIDEIAALIREAAGHLPARTAHMAAGFDAALARLRGGADVDEGRVAQEMAVLAVKADVAEELDRLRAHVGAARGLLAEDAPAGRRLDFLTQEFNREANTLCSKAQYAPLSATGLALKTVIDRFREQVQNVE